MVENSTDQKSIFSSISLTRRGQLLAVAVVYAQTRDTRDTEMYTEVVFRRRYCRSMPNSFRVPSSSSCSCQIAGKFSCRLCAAAAGTGYRADPASFCCDEASQNKFPDPCLAWEGHTQFTLSSLSPLFLLITFSLPFFSLFYFPSRVFLFCLLLAPCLQFLCVRHGGLCLSSCKPDGSPCNPQNDTSSFLGHRLLENVLSP